MRLSSLMLLLLVVVSACSREPEAPAAPASQIQGSLNHVMQGILYPNSNIIFDAQDKDPGGEPDPNDPTASSHVFYGPAYGGWGAVENAAMALYEAANLVQMPGRKCANGKDVPLQDETFQKGLLALRDVSMQAYKTAQAKDMNAMLDVADKMTQACATCHDKFRDIVIDGKPVGLEGRC
jgi:hypothetical protein